MSFNFDLIKTLYFAEKSVKTLYVNGKEQPLVCTITYNANGATSGTAPDFQEGSYGDTITLRTNTGSLAKTGYTFVGWNTNSSGTGTNYSAGGSYTINGDITLYARWAQNYTITYNGNGNTSGSAPATQNVYAGQVITISGNTGSLAKTYYTFNNWNTNSSGTGTNYTANQSWTVTGNLSLYAKWTQNNYTISYNVNGGSSTTPASQTGHGGDSITLPAAATRSGYSFLGWNTASDGTGTNYSASSSYTITGSRTLYAKWIQQYTLTFSANMASGLNYYIAGQSGTAHSKANVTQTINAGSSIGSLPTYGSGTTYTYTLSSVNYTVYIEGWYKETTCTNKISTSTVPTGNTTYYAKWKMTANVGISASITVPKFASSVSWTCYSNGGGRVAKSQSSGSGWGMTGYFMCSPGANRNGDSYTWTGAIQGKALTLDTMSCALNGVTRSVSNGANGGSIGGTFNAYSLMTNVAGSATAYNSGSYKVIYSWTKITNAKSTGTITFYYGGVLKGSRTVCTQNWTYDHEEDEYEKNQSGFDNKNGGTGTFSSGTYGADGAYGNTTSYKTSNHSISIAAASGSGYSRTVTVNA